MGRYNREDEPEESKPAEGEQTEDDSEGHGGRHAGREDEEAPDQAESEGESDEDDDDSEGHAARYHV
jgi:hypothetical protein